MFHSIKPTPLNLIENDFELKPSLYFLMKNNRKCPQNNKNFHGGLRPPNNIPTKFSFADLVNVFENQKIFLKKGEAIDMEGFIEQENVYKLDS